ncbi:MAG: hypothetical protein BGO51_28130 [Rhodospirillales bacterium 69-11]|nr:hydrogenase maturation nickel metallochaperone HypA [Rhodospirillales bacterium]OJW25183.1 MAG: hypothetical protein BGO51_28130 [Rhodospirillales bacterium 69-11]
MHELSVCRALLREAMRAAGAEGPPLRSVTVRIGPLSGVDAGLLARAWPTLSAADLLIEAAPLRVSCEACGTESAVTPQDLTCRACGDWRTRLLGGDELLLVRIGLEAEDAHV